ncbi:MAG: NADPH-dependent reductase [Patescibacteria group bacterium]|nr:NADPH-dependent reductase [Patescibacteria group bacterium]
MQPLQIVVLEGTTRVRRDSIHAARLVAEVGREQKGVEITFVDPNDFHFPGDGNDPEGKDPRYTAITAKADAFFIVSPEYNHSFPGSLKRMLDSELKNYVHKPVAFAGVSSTRWGGVRAIEALNQTVRELGLVSTFTDVHFPNVPTLFDEKGELLEPVYRKLVQSSYDELIWMARVLKWGRGNVKPDK